MAIFINQFSDMSSSTIEFLRSMLTPSNNEFI